LSSSFAFDSKLRRYNVDSDAVFGPELHALLPAVAAALQVGAYTRPLLTST
jgi:orotate phosphoribosyltransferase